MTTTPEESSADVARGPDLSDRARAHLRSALTGSIFAMAVLAYLGDHETGSVKAIATVVGTGLVICFGEAYAGLLSAALATRDRLPATEIRHELAACSTAAAPGVTAGLVLLLTGLLGIAVQTGIDIALWLGVLALTLCSVVESHGSDRPLPVKVASVGASVLVGAVIIVLKAALH